MSEDATTFFITVCTHGMKKTLATVLKTPDYSVIGEIPDVLRLRDAGEIVDSLIRSVSERFREITVSAYVVMPNHFHVLLTVERGYNSGRAVAAAVGWIKYQATKRINEISGRQTKVFQRSYYSHRVIDWRDLDNIVRYIAENPVKWGFDKYFSD